MLALLRISFSASRFFISTLSVRDTAGASGDLSLEIVAAAARVESAPNRARTNPRKSRIACPLCDSFFAVRRNPVGFPACPIGCLGIRIGDASASSAAFPVFHSPTLFFARLKYATFVTWSLSELRRVVHRTNSSLSLDR